MLTSSYKIEVRNNGASFSCFAVVLDGRGKRVHETREVPYGMRGVAYQLAEDYAASQGWTVEGTC